MPKFGLSYILNGRLEVVFVEASCEYDARFNVPSNAELRKVWEAHRTQKLGKL